MAVRSLKNSTIENFANYNSSMNAGYSFQDYELIESVFINSNTASITFNNLSQYHTEYKHLQIRATARTARADVGDTIRVRFNGFTDDAYRAHVLSGAGSSVVSFAQSLNTRFEIFRIAAANDAASAFGAAVVTILDAFESNKNKVTRSFAGSSATYREVAVGSGIFTNTSPISSITLLGGNGSFVSGSRFSLYGIR